MIAEDDKILFVFSDPGGAKPLLAFIATNKLVNYRVVSDRVYSFYDDFGVSVQKYRGEAQIEIDDFKPDKIFTATSYTSDIEREHLVSAKKNGIYCISFVDHWTDIDGRFRRKDGSVVFPDQIWLLDERAKRIAIQSGMEVDLLFISGNPFHTWLKNWKPRISKEVFYQSLGIKDEYKLLLYGPDPLSNINGKELYGFDEVSATEELYLYLKENPDLFAGWKIVLKRHPNQEISRLKIPIDFLSGFIIAESDIDTNNCIYYSDLVLGFHSSILIEASILEKKVVRFVPSGFDPLEEALPKSKIENMSELEKYLL